MSKLPSASTAFTSGDFHENVMRATEPLTRIERGLPITTHSSPTFSGSEAGAKIVTSWPHSRK